MEASGTLHSPAALPLNKESTIGWEFDFISETVWILRKIDNVRTLTGNGTSIIRSLPCVQLTELSCHLAG